MNKTHFIDKFGIPRRKITFKQYLVIYLAKLFRNPNELCPSCEYPHDNIINDNEYCCGRMGCGCSWVITKIGRMCVD